MYTYILGIKTLGTYRQGAGDERFQWHETAGYAVCWWHGTTLQYDNMRFVI